MASAPYLGENVLQFFLNMCVAELKDSPSGEDKFKSSLATVSSNSASGVPQKSVNFGAPHNRAAYMYKFQPCIAWTTYSYIQRAVAECPEVNSMITKLLNSSDLKLCCIGAGAGADLIGFLLGISSGSVKAAIKSITVIPETAEWRCTINRYIDALKTGILNPMHRFILGKNLVSTVLGCDFTKRPNSKVAQKIKEANVFLVDKVFPVAAPEVHELETTLGNIMSSMKPGALVFFVDHAAGFNVMLRTAHCTSQQILFGPLREQYWLPQLPEIFKTTYNCYPQISSRMYFMVWKKTSNSVTATLTDSVFSPFPSVSAKNETMASSCAVLSGVFASTSTRELSTTVSQEKLSSSKSGTDPVVPKGPPKTICNNSVDASYSEVVKNQNTSTVASGPPCRSVISANSTTYNSISDKTAKSLKSGEKGPSLPVFSSHNITENQSLIAEVSNIGPVISIDTFADFLACRILADARQEFLYGQSASWVSSDKSSLCADTEPSLQFHMSCNNRNVEYRNDSFAQDTHLGSFCTRTPHVTVSGTVNSLPSKESCKDWLGPFQLDKFTQTSETDDKLFNTIQNRLSELTQHVDRLTSIVEELLSSQNKEYSCCCSAASAPLSDLCLGTENKFPYLVLPLENLSDNPMLLSLLSCQSENTKS